MTFEPPALARMRGGGLWPRHGSQPDGCALRRAPCPMASAGAGDACFTRPDSRVALFSAARGRGAGIRCGGLATPAASTPSPHGPGTERPWAHPTRLRNVPGLRAGRAGAAACDTCRSALPCDSGRGHWDSARRRRPGVPCTDNRHSRSRPLAKQSTRTSATPRSCGPAGACLSPPQVRAREGRPRSPLREELGPCGSSSSGVSPPLPPDATGFGDASATGRDRPEAPPAGDRKKALPRDRPNTRMHSRFPLFLVAGGGLQSNRVRPGGEEREVSRFSIPTILDWKKEPLRVENLAIHGERVPRIDCCL